MYSGKGNRLYGQHSRFSTFNQNNLYKIGRMVETRKKRLNERGGNQNAYLVACYITADVDWVAANVGSQPGLGLLSQRRIRFGGGGSSCSFADGTLMSGRSF